MDARNGMREVANSYPDAHIIQKAATAAALSCEIAWQLIEEDLDRAKLQAEAESIVDDLRYP
jgi:hypothetical protein